MYVRSVSIQKRATVASRVAGFVFLTLANAAAAAFAAQSPSNTFLQSCASCHGKTGKGSSLEPGAPGLKGVSFNTFSYTVR